MRLPGDCVKGSPSSVGESCRPAPHMIKWVCVARHALAQGGQGPALSLSAACCQSSTISPPRQRVRTAPGYGVDGGDGREPRARAPAPGARGSPQSGKRAPARSHRRPRPACSGAQQLCRQASARAPVWCVAAFRARASAAGQVALRDPVTSRCVITDSDRHAVLQPPAGAWAASDWAANCRQRTGATALWRWRVSRAQYAARLA